MIIERYSIHGFKPQYQSYHMKQRVDYHLNDFDINVFPEWIREDIYKDHLSKVDFFKENYNDFKYGIWAFIEGCKSNQALNHLTRKVPCWKAEISDDIIVYDVNWERKIKITDVECKLMGFYIPYSQMNSLKIL